MCYLEKPLETFCPGEAPLSGSHPELPLSSSAPPMLPRRKPHQCRQTKLPLKIYFPCDRMGRADREAGIAPAHCLLGTARAGSWCMAGTIHTHPGGRGKLWGCAQSFLLLSHPSHSCASEAIVLVPAVGNPRSSWKRPIHTVPGEPQRPQKQTKKKRGFSSLYIKAPSRPHFLPLPAIIRESTQLLLLAFPTKGDL